MSEIAQGNRAELILSPGDVYRVSTGGIATVEAAYGAPAGTTTVNANSQDFGPYAANAKLIVRAVTGSASYGINQATPLQSRNGYLDDASRAALANSQPKNAFGFSMIGDSRTADLLLGQGKNSRNWFNWACAYYKQAPRLIGAYGASSKRTDEFLTNGNFDLALADAAQFLVFGFPAVNDIGQSTPGYTDTFGRSVTVANVAALAVDNIIVYAKRAVAYGKKVIALTEPGSTSLDVTRVAAVHEFNRLLKTRIAEVPGAVLYDPCPLLWNATSSTTLISFKTNYSGDGTHAQQIAARAVGSDFAANVLPTIIPKIDTAPANINDTVANGTGQLLRNPLLNTLTGGTTGSNITLSSGTVPANTAIASTVAGLSVAITSAANAQGFGNDVTYAFTASGAVTGNIDLQANNADWSLADLFEGRLEMDIASGSTAVGVYPELYVQTNAGTNEFYDLYSGASGPMSTAAETGLVYRTPRGGVVAGSITKSAVQIRIRVVFTGAGSCTITIRRPGIYRYAA